VVENLNKDMHNEDLQKLFEKWGKLTRCGIKFDKLGASKGLADIEFSTHEECEKAIKEIDNAEINGVKVRVKYAPNRYPKYSRRTRSAGVQRRNLRKANRNNRRGLRTRRTGRRGIIDRTPSGRRNFRTKRRNFARTLGRRRQEKKQN
jgi:RNA recognition motif-containing protein